jgi:hypothetical protein
MQLLSNLHIGDRALSETQGVSIGQELAPDCNRVLAETRAYRIRDHAKRNPGFIEWWAVTPHLKYSLM